MSNYHGTTRDDLVAKLQFQGVTTHLPGPMFYFFGGIVWTLCVEVTILIIYFKHFA